MPEFLVEYFYIFILRNTLSISILAKVFSIFKLCFFKISKVRWQHCPTPNRSRNPIKAQTPISPAPKRNGVATVTLQSTFLWPTLNTAVFHPWSTSGQAVDVGWSQLIAIAATKCLWLRLTLIPTNYGRHLSPKGWKTGHFGQWL